MVEFSATGDYWSKGQFCDSNLPGPGLADSLPVKASTDAALKVSETVLLKNISQYDRAKLLPG
jgi:hypothetical protein